MKSPDWSKKMNAQKLNRAEYSPVLFDNEYRENADGWGAGLQVVGGGDSEGRWQSSNRQRFYL